MVLQRRIQVPFCTLPSQLLCITAGSELLSLKWQKNGLEQLVISASSMTIILSYFANPTMFFSLLFKYKAVQA